MQIENKLKVCEAVYSIQLYYNISRWNKQLRHSQINHKDVISKSSFSNTKYIL